MWKRYSFLQLGKCCYLGSVEQEERIRRKFSIELRLNYSFKCIVILYQLNFHIFSYFRAYHTLCMLKCVLLLYSSFLSVVFYVMSSTLVERSFRVVISLLMKQRKKLISFLHILILFFPNVHIAFHFSILSYTSYTSVYYFSFTSCLFFYVLTNYLGRVASNKFIPVVTSLPRSYKEIMLLKMRKIHEFQ